MTTMRARLVFCLALAAACLPGAGAVVLAQAGAQPDEQIHDAANPARQQLQSSAEAVQGLPRDKHGAVDWVRALRNGVITPRADLDGRQGAQVLDLDVLLKNTKEMPYVRFPHRAHTEWLACGNCHDSLFVPKAGANPINMDKIFRGQYCGACHGRVAFITHLACERCHSVPQRGAKPWW